MCWAFDTLGATYSCQFSGHGSSITTIGRENNCYDVWAPIQFHNHINGPELIQIKNESIRRGIPLRGVMIVRDPLQMVVSAYCYHHRGAEPNSNLAPPNITEMGPEEGVPDIAERMKPVIEGMLSAYQLAPPNVLTVRYETMTNSSFYFNATMSEILTFLFGDEITHAQKQTIIDAAAVEDLNRGLEGGLSTGGGSTGVDNHTNSEDCMADSQEALNLISEKTRMYYEEWRNQLGYVSYV